MGKGGGAPGGTTLTPSSGRRPMRALVGALMFRGTRGSQKVKMKRSHPGMEQGHARPQERTTLHNRALSPAGPSVRMWGGLTGRPTITTCTCSETHCGPPPPGCWWPHSAFYRSSQELHLWVVCKIAVGCSLDVWRHQSDQPLDLHTGQPVLCLDSPVWQHVQWGEVLMQVCIYVNRLALRTVTLLVCSENVLYCSHGFSQTRTLATPLYRVAGRASLDEVQLISITFVSLIPLKCHRVVHVFFYV